MLGAIREFALEQLEARGEADDVRRRHAEAFRALAERADRGIRGPDEARWARLVAREFDNLRAAVTWSIAEQDVDLVLSTALTLFRWALYRAREEVFRWSEEALELPGADAHALFAPVCGCAGWGAAVRGDLARAHELADRGLATASDPEDPARALPLEVQSTVAMFEGLLDDAVRLGRESERLVDDPYERVNAFLTKSLAATYSGDAEGGLELARRFRREAETLRSPMLLAWASYTEGEALMRPDPQGAITSFEDAIAHAESVDGRFLIGVAQVSLASLQARHGDASAALMSFRELIELWQRAGAWTQLWTTLRSVADAFARLGSFEAAAVLHAALMEAETAPPAYGDDAERLAALARTLQAELDSDVLERARATGRALSDDDVVRVVLDEIDRVLTAPGR